MVDLTRELQQRLAEGGFTSAVVSTLHLPGLQEELGQLLEQGLLNRDFYDEIVSRYDLKFHFEGPPGFPTARSIIITVAPQPKTIATFKLAGTMCTVVIPPTYIHDTDKVVLDIISKHLEPDGYRAVDALLPGKLLAVHSGLAAYGRNNIAYVEGLGSYFRLRAFFSDVPCTSDHWQELRMMDRCTDCVICSKRCPAGVITGDRFLIDASRCITYFNEGYDEFPGWIDPAWHNCVVGCMICQDVCPANRDFVDWIVEGAEFSDEETRMILDSESITGLPPETIEKLKDCSIYDDGPLQRNLRVLVDKIRK